MKLTIEQRATLVLQDWLKYPEKKIMVYAPTSAQATTLVAEIVRQLHVLHEIAYGSAPTHTDTSADTTSAPKE